jgi:hypothetical protein
VTVTLARIEAEVQARCGPFEQPTAASGTATTVVVDALRSSIPLGGYTDRWLLRRAASTDDDRQRRVAAYDPATGTLTVDRAYAAPVVAGELLEIGVLDPLQELRRAVLRGLARCYFVERAAVEVTPGQVAENLSAALFWVTDVGQIRDIQSRVGTNHATPLCWYRLLSSSNQGVAGGLRVDADTTPPGAGVYVVEALRPHATWVNGADAPDWVPDDEDELAAPLDYAAALGHAEAWRRCRATLAPIARAGYAEGIESVQREVARLVRGQWWYWDRPDRVRLGDPGGYGTGATASPTWRTVEEGYTWRGLEARTWRDVMERA